MPVLALDLAPHSPRHFRTRREKQAPLRRSVAVPSWREADLLDDRPYLDVQGGSLPTSSLKKPKRRRGSSCLATNVISNQRDLGHKEVFFTLASHVVKNPDRVFSILKTGPSHVTAWVKVT